MLSQKSNYSDSMLSDFSAALLRVNDKNQQQGLAFTGDKTVNITSSDYASSANHNLSSVLSQIQDDGPAYTDSVKPDNFLNLLKNKNEATSNNQQNAGLNSGNDLSAHSAQLQHDRITNADISETKKNHGIWLMFLLMLCVAAWLALSLFRLDSRTSELEESLNLYDASVQDSIISQTQSENLSLSITNTDETLQSLQQELQHIKTDYAGLDEKFTESIANGMMPQLDEVVSVKDSVAALRDEILELKTELKTVKTTIKTTHKDKSSVDKIVVSGGLTVNLASLTNKTKIEKLAEQLQLAGFFPLIQQTVVKGNRVYRLSVSGFSNRNEAEAFIDKAASQYGMKDGWIRKS